MDLKKSFRGDKKSVYSRSKKEEDVLFCTMQNIMKTMFLISAKFAVVQSRYG